VAAFSNPAEGAGPSGVDIVEPMPAAGV
jgi:hypothetical protein